MARNVFTIPAGQSFVDALADSLLARSQQDPSALVDTLVLLPTRRACRALREAFLRRSEGQAMLLPVMRPIGDVDEEELVLAAPDPALKELLELPPAVSEMERLFVLARLILKDKKEAGSATAGFDNLTLDQALSLARELARLLDQMQTEDVSFDALDTLVPELFADHWNETLRFLSLIRTVWPDYLAATQQIDPADRRARLMMAQADAWRTMPPQTPIIAAGSTGTIPATAALLAVVADLPQGAVILPGLDQHLDAESWQAVYDDETHPQHGLSRLLEKLQVSRSDVPVWGGGMPGELTLKRQQFLSEAMRPAETTSRWEDLAGVSAEGMAGVAWLEAPSPAMEAALAATQLREVLETPERTAALITPDRELARRVATQMRRWGIEIDDSAGIPLSNTQAGRFFLLVAEALLKELAPVSLLAVLKHPLAALGRTPAELRRAVRHLEILCLRGPTPAPGWRGLRNSIAATQGGRADPGPQAREEGIALVAEMEAAFAPLHDALLSDAQGKNSKALDVLVRAHLETAEALAKTATQSGADRLWLGDDGEALAEFLGDIQGASASLTDLNAAEYGQVLEALMVGRTVRPRYGAHPRLAILGPLEARLHHADRMILAGLNEGTWPPEPQQDPWLSQEMRRGLGLPVHARRIGLSAHDFAQACGASDVIWLRAAKKSGQETVPARWLERTSAVLQRMGRHDVLAGRARVLSRLLAWQHHLDSAESLPLIGRPEPRPPVADRPVRLSATRIETLLRDPYSIYAQYVLGLTALDPLEADLGVADRGTMIHKALETFVKAFPGPLPEDALEHLLAAGREAFGRDFLARPAVRAFWWPRFERLAAWFVNAEAEHRARVVESHLEIRGKTKLTVGDFEFELTAEADRIDRLDDGSFVILDYKTGSVPTAKEVETFQKPQLILEGAILLRGGFPDIPANSAIREFSYWKLSGATPPGEQIDLSKLDAEGLSRQVWDFLEALVGAYSNEETPYRSLPRPEEAPKYNDYEHLARVKEWARGGLGGTDGTGGGDHG